VPEKLVLLDASEANLYNIQMDLKHQVGYLESVPILGRVQDTQFMDQVFIKYKPKVVFHAAAYKHVPMLERNPWEAVYNNIRGANIVMEKSIQHKAEYFVLVSTDKAVRPTNVMGASKRVCELIMQSIIKDGTRMMAVRFGNVTGSSGSVIPLFRKQIASGGPVTVTHPEITRYFMTIQEATQLILQTGALGKGGEIFILEMGTPVKIADMARDLIRLSGKEPDKDIQITYTGLRPGEKLYEELISEGEGIVPTRYDKILVLKTVNQWNGMNDQASFRKWLMENIEELYEFANARDACKIREKLEEIVPEYNPQDSDCVL
jgi:FlaA1/EpsC-like NDP-sugar epimerase